MRVKRWLAGAAALCMVGLCASCTGGAGTGESIAVTGDAAPLFYYSQGGLYMVRGDEKPRLLTDDVEEPPYVDINRSFPGVQGFYLLRADGQWLYYGVEAENFFLIQWYPDEASAKAKLAQLEELGDGKQYLVDLSLKRTNPTEAENFGNSNPVQLRS